MKFLWTVELGEGRYWPVKCKIDWARPVNLPINKGIEETNDLTGRAIGKLQWREGSVVVFNNVNWNSGNLSLTWDLHLKLGFFHFQLKNAFCNLFHPFTMIAFCIFDSCETWDTELSLCFLKLSFLQLTWHNCTDKKENHICEVNTTALVWLDITNVPPCVAVPNYKIWHCDLYEDFLWRNIWALKRPCTEMSYLSAKTSTQLFSFQNGVTFF